MGVRRDWIVVRGQMSYRLGGDARDVAFYLKGWQAVAIGGFKQGKGMPIPFYEFHPGCCVGNRW